MTDSLSRRIARTARLFPERPALVSGDQVWSYRELNAVAGQLASMVSDAAHQAGHGPGGRVALLLKGRAETLIGMLGVVMGGHGHVTLDPADPDARVEMILRDCRPFAIVTTAAHRDRLRNVLPEDCRFINSELMTRAGDSQPPEEGLEDGLAFMYYTSGSTGRPKGVCHTQRNLLHGADCYSDALGVTESDRFSALYSLSFAASLMDTYPALLNGAAVCSYDMRRDGIPRLADWIDQNGITILHLGATVFRKLMAAVDRDRCFDSVRAVVVGGDTLFSSDLESFGRHFPSNCRFTNGYSATEVGLVALHSTLADRPLKDGAGLPVGRPIPDVEVRIRRPDGADAAVGETGNIVIHSRYLTPGYWQRPKLNEEVFSTDSSRPGWRSFATGDQGRIGADGDIYLNGRRGTRVKIRGYTVELAEVESGLRQCPDVADAVVVALSGEDEQEVEGLAAYVVAGSGQEINALTLRRELAELLPSHMLPSSFHGLSTLPVTATGKLDRRVLEKDARDRRHERTNRAPYKTPVGPTEQAVAAVFEHMLGHAPIGRNDDFFLLGGDSLSVVRLQLELENVVGGTLPQERLLEDASVAGVARALAELDSGTGDEASLVVVTMRETGFRPTIFLVHGRNGHAHVSPGFLRMLDDDLSLHVFQARGLDGRHDPRLCIEEMARDYVQAARQVQSSGPYLLAALCAGGYIAIEMARMLRESGEQTAPLLLVDPLVLPAAPSRGPMEYVRRVGGALFPFLRRYHNWRLRLSLRSFHDSGRIDYDDTNLDRRRGAVEVAAALNQAVLRHRPAPYDGAVELLLSSMQMGPERWGDPDSLRAVFSGEVRCHEVAKTHEQALDFRNDRVVRQFRESVRFMRESVEVENLPSCSEKRPKTPSQRDVGEIRTR